MNEDEQIQAFLSTGTEPRETSMNWNQVLDLMMLNHHCTSSERKEIPLKYSKYPYIKKSHENVINGD